jgi:hypothetical protein
VTKKSISRYLSTVFFKKRGSWASAPLLRTDMWLARQSRNRILRCGSVRSAVLPASEDADFVRLDLVNRAMLGIDPSGPDPRSRVS